MSGPTAGAGGTADGRSGGRLWSPVPDWSKAVIARGRWQVRPVPGLCQVTINGAVAPAAAALAPGAPEVGLWGIANADPVFVRLARDRALLVSSAHIEVAEGIWQPEGWVASRSDDAFAVFALSGPEAPDVVAEGSSAELGRGSPSAAVLFAGVTVALYRMAEDHVRLHVPADMAPYLWRWLETR